LFLAPKTIGRPQTNKEIFARPSNMYCLLTHWSEVKNSFGVC